MSMVIECNGVSLTVEQWAERQNINKSTIKTRLRNGWTAEAAIYTKVDKKYARIKGEGNRSGPKTRIGFDMDYVSIDPIEVCRICLNCKQTRCRGECETVRACFRELRDKYKN